MIGERQRGPMTQISLTGAIRTLTELFPQKVPILIKVVIPNPHDHREIEQQISLPKRAS